ncbi:ACR COG1678 domain containing protein [Nitzschia inconspicua]|uniref:ACR COG1678 domain containing protein n=1 Tax=Nitzschia inconspicua TaxID=303405 RepID=A0A9K3L8I6_9STRA|nr:ACR COG1678 domain containing protein [Nitzschia inconspicua]
MVPAPKRYQQQVNGKLKRRMGKRPVFHALMVGLCLQLLLLQFPSMKMSVNAFMAKRYWSDKQSNSRSTQRRCKYHHQQQNNLPFMQLYSAPSSSSTSDSSSKIRYLGSGPNAIVREGVVLLAPVEEYHHFLRQAAVFVYAMGETDDSDYVVRGVIVDHPTPFTMKEMMEDKPSDADKEVYNNLIFRGGDTGGESAFGLHTLSDLGVDEIGTSGIYQGGDFSSVSSVVDSKKVKFFFNYMEFTEQELEDMLEVKYEDGDCWTSVEVPPELVLSSEYDRGEAWARLRNAVRDDIEASKQQILFQQQQQQREQETSDGGNE